MLANGLVRQGCESTAKFKWIGIVKDNKEGLRMTRVIFSRCVGFGSRFPFLKSCSYSPFPSCSWLCFYMFFFLYVDYSVYVTEIALFRISLFLSHVWTRRLKSVTCFWVWIKCFSKKEKKGKQLGAVISLPRCLATGIGNLTLKAVTGPKSRNILLGMTLCRWRAFVC